MKYLLSRGLIYNKTEDNILTIWNNNKFITLTKNESIIWNIFSWSPKNMDLLKDKNIPAVNYLIENMISNAVISAYESDDIKECNYFILAKNKIKLLNISLTDKLKSGNYKQLIKNIKSFNNLTSFDKMVYNYIKDYNGEISISDIVLILDDNLFNMDYFTDGYTLEYMRFAKKSPSSEKVIESIIKLLDAKLIYIS